MVNEGNDGQKDQKTGESDEEFDTEEIEDDSEDEGKLKCVLCGEVVSEDDDTTYVGSDPSNNEWFADESKSGDLCLGCMESIETYPNSVIAKFKGKTYKFIFDQGVVINSNEDYGDIPDEVIEGVRSIVKSEHYVRTDGWRGYVDVNGGDKLVQIEDFNVLSGHHSETMRVEEDKIIKRAFSKLGIAIFETVTTTSNIFAANASYFVAKEHEQAAKNVIEFIKDWFGTEDWRWNIGVVFSDLQHSPPTKAVLEDMRNKGELKGVNWKEIAYPSQANVQAST